MSPEQLLIELWQAAPTYQQTVLQLFQSDTIKVDAHIRAFIILLKKTGEKVRLQRLPAPSFSVSADGHSWMKPFQLELVLSKHPLMPR